MKKVNLNRLAWVKREAIIDERAAYTEIFSLMYKDYFPFAKNAHDRQEICVDKSMVAAAFREVLIELIYSYSLPVNERSYQVQKEFFTRLEKALPNGTYHVANLRNVVKHCVSSSLEAVFFTQLKIF